MCGRAPLSLTDVFWQAMRRCPLQHVQRRWRCFGAPTRSPFFFSLSLPFRVWPGRAAVDDLVLMSTVDEASIVAVLKKRYTELQSIYTCDACGGRGERCSL